MVRGNMSVPADNLTDPVIVKSNGVPTYNFAVVIDDHEMQISHILRGEEHLYNTATQICIMRALGYDDKEVIYGHLSLVVNETGKKLSKRDASLKQFISDYQQMGYLPAAVVNFLALLG
jgi:glutamyl-tRNA synthetase